MRTLIVLAAACLMLFSGCLATEDPPESPVDPGTEEPAEPTANGTTGPLQEETVGWTAGVSGCGVVFLAELAGTDHAEVAIQRAAQGAPFNATFTSTAPAVQMGVSFFEGTTFLESFSSMEPEVSGTVPEAADVGIFWSCGGAEVSVAFLAGA